MLSERWIIWAAYIQKVKQILLAFVSAEHHYLSELEAASSSVSQFVWNGLQCKGLHPLWQHAAVTLPGISPALEEEKGSIQSMAKMCWDERAGGAALQYLFLVGRVVSLMSDVSVCIFFHLGGSLIELFPWRNEARLCLRFLEFF